MAIEVTMPRLSDTMEQGTIVAWHVKEGDSVSTGDVLADIETDKATMELESFDEGTVASIKVEAGKAVAVGSLIMTIADEGEDVSEAAAAGAEAAPKKKQAESSTESSSAAPTATATAPRPASTNGASTSSASGGRIFASPLAKKIAADENIDLGSISGTGPSGRITKKDVESALSSGGAAPAASPAAQAPQPIAMPATSAGLEAQTVPLSTMRGVIARRLVESKTTIPHYQVTVEVDMEPLLALRSQLNEQLESQGVKLSVNDFLVRACALGMQQQPYVNSRWASQDGQPAIEILGNVNVGIAIALPEERGGGLVVATLRNADAMGLRQISQESKRLAKKARESGLSVEDMSDSTFTISNLGMFGVAHFTAIINPPNSAILAVGEAQERAVVRDGQIVPGRVMSMTMSSDHRIIDGAIAAQYLGAVRQYLEQPATLLV